MSETWKKAIVILAVLLTASGCVSTSSVMINSNRKYPPTKSVVILFSEPERSYEVIAIVEGNGTQFNNYSDVLKKIQGKARKIGAHAIIPLTNENQHVANSYVRNFDGSPVMIPGGKKITIKAAAIRFK